jgi:hypothetical protein
MVVAEKNGDGFEERVTRGEALEPAEESTMADIQMIQRFVEIENATLSS